LRGDQTWLDLTIWADNAAAEENTMTLSVMSEIIATAMILP